MVLIGDIFFCQVYYG